MDQIKIIEVRSKQDLKDFVQFPFTLYAGSPYWVPSMRSDDMAVFNREKNPAFAYCESRQWLAYKKGKVVGRIAGIINRAYIEKWKSKYARFGWIDFVDDPYVLKELISAVENWARERGLTGIHGPLGFTDLDPEGMLVDGFSEPGTMQTIYNHSYYPLYLEQLGFEKDVDWLENEITIPQRLPERIERMAALIEKRYDLHRFHAKKAKDLLVYARAIFELINTTYKDLYGVVPLSSEQIDTYVKQYFPLIQLDYVSVVLDKYDQVAAFAIAMPSLTKALQKSNGKLFPFGIYHLYKAFQKNDCADLYLVAVRPDLQGKGVNSILMSELGTSFINKKIRTAITHPSLETNDKVLSLWSEFDTRLVKRRRCYVKNIPKTELK
ncbi:MAG: GNAT family N-acetyltransferase [bacterium]|nr:GNAT family N-acetyltransferase [bacterium]